jgi:uncharacterized protein
MKVLRISGIKLSLDEDEEQLAKKITSALSISSNDVISLEVIKKALDARRGRAPHFVYAVKLIVGDELEVPQPAEDGIQLQKWEDKPSIPCLSRTSAPGLPVVVAGSGPAGLFAAYTLVQRGLPVLLLERGVPVEKRMAYVQAFWEKGILNPCGNVLFGEGGAGTFSDGKLTSRSKNPASVWVKKVLVEMGAPASIITDAKPHIGTDRLRKVVINLRNKLLSAGCIIRFEAQATGLVIRSGRLVAIVVNEKEEIRADRLVLAVGQSADDTYRMLAANGVRMEAKPFAMGLRVEHPQELINSIQYGKWSGHPHLPPAEYFVTAAIPHENRSVYTFCMCPGGAVIGCSAFPGYVLTNGMSNYQRDGKFANSAVVVNVRVDDFSPRGEPLAGLDFRDEWEKKAFLAGGGNYRAPAQKLLDFLKKKTANSIGQTSFRPGVKACSLQEIIPDFVAGALRSGISEFNRKMPGFITTDAHLIGVETRTSSPVRISRKRDGESETVAGIYPCGEGSGYAGGIISSALDGIKAARHLIDNLA